MRLREDSEDWEEWNEHKDPKGLGRTYSATRKDVAESVRTSRFTILRSIVVQWINDVVKCDPPISPDSMMERLHDGDVLCAVAERVFPLEKKFKTHRRRDVGPTNVTDSPVTTSKFPYISNARQFLQCCDDFGVPSVTKFAPDDLVKGEHEFDVVNHILSLILTQTSVAPPDSLRKLPNVEELAARGRRRRVGQQVLSSEDQSLIAQSIMQADLPLSDPTNKGEYDLGCGPVFVRAMPLEAPPAGDADGDDANEPDVRVRVAEHVWIPLQQYANEVIEPVSPLLEDAETQHQLPVTLDRNPLAEEGAVAPVPGLARVSGADRADTPSGSEFEEEDPTGANACDVINMFSEIQGSGEAPVKHRPRRLPAVPDGDSESVATADEPPQVAHTGSSPDPAMLEPEYMALSPDELETTSFGPPGDVDKAAGGGSVGVDGMDLSTDADADANNLGAPGLSDADALSAGDDLDDHSRPISLVDTGELQNNGHGLLARHGNPADPYEPRPESALTGVHSPSPSDGDGMTSGMVDGTNVAESDALHGEAGRWRDRPASAGFGSLNASLMEAVDGLEQSIDSVPIGPEGNPITSTPRRRRPPPVTVDCPAEELNSRADKDLAALKAVMDRLKEGCDGIPSDGFPDQTDLPPPMLRTPSRASEANPRPSSDWDVRPQAAPPKRRVVRRRYKITTETTVTRRPITAEEYERLRRAPPNKPWDVTVKTKERQVRKKTTYSYKRVL